MTDPVTADHIYLLPLTVESIDEDTWKNDRSMLYCLQWVVKQPSTWLSKLTKHGVWERYNVRMIGVDHRGH